MANIITAGNSTNGGTAISTDTSGTLNIVTGSGSGATAVTVDGSGNVVVTGTISASGGVSGGIRSGTAVSASGTSIDFTSLPTGIKRITVMFNATSLNATGAIIVQVGSGSFTTSGYAGAYGYYQNAGASSSAVLTTGFGAYAPAQTAAEVQVGVMVITNLSGNTWISAMNGTNSNTGVGYTGSGTVTFGGVLDRVRITTVAGTSSFDAGTINILFE
jgi:hypothetical protein